MRELIKGFAGSSALYGLGGMLMCAVAFFLLPVYTRYMTPADYGVLAVTDVVQQILTIVFPLGLAGAMTRYYFVDEDPRRQRSNIGTLWLTILVFAGLGILALDHWGGVVFGLFFQKVPFSPNIRLAVWVAFFNAVFTLVHPLLQLQKRPLAFFLLSVSSQAVVYGAMCLFLVWLNNGVTSYLQGRFWANFLLIIPYVWILAKNIRLDFNFTFMKTALAFGLPLVPHTLAAWILDFSDRIILERYVPLGDLGFYSMAYQFGYLMYLVATALNSAWLPIFYKLVAQEDQASRDALRRMVTYFILGLCFLGLAQGLFIRELIMLFTAKAFHASAGVAVWVIAGQLLFGVCYIPSHFIMWRNKTSLLSLVTVICGAINIGLNLLLVPSHGYMAAAWVTCASYAIMLCLSWGLAARLHPFPYEYRRLAIAMSGAGALLLVGNLAMPQGLLPAIGAKMLLLAAFPGLLLVGGFFEPEEKQAALALARRLRGMLGRG